MKDYVLCMNMGGNSCVRFQNYRNNRNAGLSPLEKYGEATLALHLKNIKATTMKGYFPCINIGR